MQSKILRFLLIFLVALLLLASGWIWLTLNWSYSQGERAGYVQKLSKKGWLCKTWEGEIAMVTMAISPSQVLHSQPFFDNFCT